MRAYIVILYTNNLSRLHIFSAKYLPLVQSAGNRHYLVFLQGNTPLSNAFENPDLEIFSCFPDLRKRLSVSPFLLSDVIVVIDSQSVQNEGDGKQLRDIIVEFPDVKFVFWADKNSEKESFKNNLFPIDPDTQDLCEPISASVLNSCINIIEDAYESQDVQTVLEGLVNDLDEHDSLTNDSKFFLKESWDKWKIEKKQLGEEPFLNDFIPVLYAMLIKYVARDSVLFDLAFFPRKGSSNEIVDLITGYDNLFDANNCRYACKQWGYANLNIRRRNFKRIQDSRKNHMALCVEEERGQNRYNSYCLYANGFRVLPITSATELLYIRNSEITTDVIVRDYDLQFPDPPESMSTHDGSIIRSIDAIRGFSSAGTFVSNSPIWDKYYHDKVPVFFISKGDPGKVEIINGPIHQYHGRFDPSIPILPGIVKPVNGIHVPFKALPEINSRFETVYASERPSINTERMNHNHGVPLTIYEAVQSIIDRAWQYYKQEKYIHAAVLANEAMENMNGFHQSLMLKAYHLFAISENAVSMNAIGVNDKELKKDTHVRIEKIARDVGWILQMRKDSIGNEQSRNVLNQIYSDCRIFCRDREHFESEEAFISAMGHLNASAPISKVGMSVIKSFSRIKESVKDCYNHFCNLCDEDLCLMLKELSEVIKKEEASLFIGKDGVFQKKPKELASLKRHKRKYKRLSGKEWVRLDDNATSLSLIVDTKTRIGIKRKSKSLFEKIRWESSDVGIARFEGNVLCAHGPGTVTLTAMIGDQEIASIEIVVKSENSIIDNVKTSVEE